MAHFANDEHFSRHVSQADMINQLVIWMVNHIGYRCFTTRIWGEHMDLVLLTKYNVCRNTCNNFDVWYIHNFLW